MLHSQCIPRSQSKSGVHARHNVHDMPDMLPPRQPETNRERGRMALSASQLAMGSSAAAVYTGHTQRVLGVKS